MKDLSRLLQHLSLIVIYVLKLVSTKNDCDLEMRTLWSAKLREAPITAPPLLFDIDGDGFDDLVVPSSTGEVWGIHGENGHIVDGWPFYLEDRGFHASPLVYDINGDDQLEFVLTTSNAEILFVETDNTLLYGETIKIPPLRTRRDWHKEDPAHVKNMAKQMPDDFKQETLSQVEQKKIDHTHQDKRGHRHGQSNRTAPYSEFESRFGRHANPLYSKHDPTPRLSGIDLSDSNYVFVDPHVLATPTISDVNGDGIYAELVVPVSYYFDLNYYNDPSLLDDLNQLPADELFNFVGGGVVIIDLRSGKVLGEKLLVQTTVVDGQPGYMLASPTVVRLVEGEDPVIIIGSAAGEVHVLNGRSLINRVGFPLVVDSVISQVAVGDLYGNGKLDLVVGDYSGNVFCVDGDGVRVWESELGDEVVSAAVRLVDVEGDGDIECVVVSKSGSVWILNSQTGKNDVPQHFPIHLSAGVEAPVLIQHLITRGSTTSQGDEGVAVVVMATSNGVYVVNSKTGCVDNIADTSGHVIYEVLSGDIDPYHSGLELVAVGLDGTLTCITMETTYEGVEREAWSMDAMGTSIFAHKASSFYFSANVSGEVTGNTFFMSLLIHTNIFKTESKFSISVSVGTQHILYDGTTMVQRRKTVVNLELPTPSNPLKAFLTIRLCNHHQQCRSKYISVRFNMHFEDNLRWFLCIPFISLCILILWVHRREEGSLLYLPTATTSSRGHTTGVRKDL